MAQLTSLRLQLVKEKQLDNSCLSRFKSVWQNSGDGARELYMIQETQEGRETLVWRKTHENPSALVLPELQQLLPAQHSIIGAAPLPKHQRAQHKRHKKRGNPAVTIKWSEHTRPFTHLIFPGVIFNVGWGVFSPLAIEYVLTVTQRLPSLLCKILEIKPQSRAPL